MKISNFDILKAAYTDNFTAIISVYKLINPIFATLK